MNKLFSPQMQNSENSPSQQLITPEDKQIVYMMPSQDFEEDEIDLLQLFLPLVKYKLQIMLVMAACVIISMMITLMFGKVQYTNSLIYKHTNKGTILRFLPEKHFFLRDELARARSLLKSYWDIPDEMTDYQLAKHFNGPEIKKPVLSFTENKNIENGFSLTVTTDNPGQTLNALAGIYSYSIQRNRELIREQNTTQLKKLKKEKETYYRRFSAVLNKLDAVKFVKTGTSEYLYSKTPRYLYVLENISGKRRAIKIDSTRMGRIMQSSKITDILAFSKSLPTLPEQLSSARDEIFKNSEDLLLLTTERKTKSQVVAMLEWELEEPENRENAAQYQEKNSSISEEISMLSTKIAVLQNSLNLVILDYKIIQARLKELIYIKQTLSGLQANNWVNITNESKNEKENLNYYSKLEEKIAAVQLPYIQNYDQSLKDVNKKIEKIIVSNVFNENKNIRPSGIYTDVWEKRITMTPLTIVQPPDAKMMETKLSLGFGSGKRDGVEAEKSSTTQKLEIAKAMFRNKKTLIILFVVSLFLAIFSVFIRVFAGKMKSSENYAALKQEFLEALKYYKL